MSLRWDGYEPKQCFYVRFVRTFKILHLDSEQSRPNPPLKRRAEVIGATKLTAWSRARPKARLRCYPGRDQIYC